MGKKPWGLAALAIVCSIVMIGICGLKTSAAPTLNSRGNFVADEGKVIFYDTDLAYLDNELDSLENEIDDTIFDMSDIREVLNPRRNGLQSRGIIDYDNGKVVISATDLTHMADGIDRLENDYVSAAVSALGRIGTYLDGSGNIGHSETSDGDSVLYSCDRIKEGILQSQDVGHLGDVTPITADNLTAGTAAWVDGNCVIGNGADNERAYEKGREDGEDGTGEDIFDLEYIYHRHWGEQAGAGTGCYQGYHKHSSGCYVTRSCSGYVSCESIGGTIDYGCHTAYTVYGYCSRCNSNASYDVCVSRTDECAHSSDGTTHRYKVTICSSPYNAWRLACGKTEGVSYDAVIMIIRKQDKANTKVGDEANMEVGDEANTEADDEVNTEEDNEADTEEDDEVNTEEDEEANTEEDEEANTEVDDKLDTEADDEVNTEVNDEVKEQDDEE